MEELSTKRQSELAWGSIANIVDKISDEEEKIDGGWPELIDVVADAMTEEGSVKSTTNAFVNLFNFLYHVLFRVKESPIKREFNMVSKLKIDGKEVYRINNYDYKSFKWAKSEGLASKVKNDYLDLPADKLTEAQRKAFDARCGKEKHDN